MSTVTQEERLAALEAVPPGTVVRVGWETQPGRVQGGVFLRTERGLIPCRLGRDETAAWMLTDIARRDTPHDHQPWAIETLAVPVGES